MNESSDDLPKDSPGSAEGIALIPLLVKVVSLPAVMLFCLTVFVMGLFIGGTALHDPDTCWLLAMGREIAQTKSIPQTDPFSFTFSLFADQMYVPYQWMTEICLYGAYKLFQLTGVLLLVAVLITPSFVIVPLMIFRRARTPMITALFLTFVGIIASFFHFLARPEIFSYLFLALLLLALAGRREHLRLHAENSKFVADWPFIAYVAFMMALWANCHTGFISGLLVLLVYFLASTCARFFLKQPALFDLSALIAFVLGIFASCLNPFGIKLWAYIPQLFFVPFNNLIEELKPLNFADPTFYPFLLLLLIVAVVVCKNLTAPAKRSYGAEFISISLIVVSAVQGFQHRRLIPFAVLIVLSELAQMLSPASESDSHSLWIFSPGKPKWLAAFIALATSGVLICSLNISKPTLPQSGKAFKAPSAAIEFLKGKYDLQNSSENPANVISGNVFNYDQYGDLMDWNLPKNPKVFIDTRYDMYGPKLIEDYQSITSLKGDWQKLMERYKISLVFFPSNSPLVRTLSKEANWKNVYADDVATIMQKLPQNSTASRVDSGEAK